LLDIRNDFEHKIGTFPGALNPGTTAFHEFPDFVRERLGSLRDKRIVTLCTGGIRCEKATSWILDQGFTDLYQLDGGILNYFARIEDADHDWQGRLFVFDQRQTVDTKIAPHPLDQSFRGTGRAQVACRA
jgi:UPF0176 protein